MENHQKYEYLAIVLRFNFQFMILPMMVNPLKFNRNEYAKKDQSGAAQLHRKLDIELVYIG